MLKLPVLLALAALTGSIAGGTILSTPETTYAKTKTSICTFSKPQKNCGKHNIQEVIKKNGITVIVGSINKPCTGNPNIPDKPGTDKPGKPNKPSTPGKPDRPNTPDKPGKPDRPNTPDKPGKPDRPSTPDKPGKPDQPETDNSYAAQVVKLVNQERKKAGLKELTMKTDVTKAANVRAKEIVTSFSHTRPNGTKFTTALTESGVKYKGAGENIAWGQKTPEAVMDAWMNSKGHRDNILNKNYTSIGVGYYKDASGRQYWTQLFTY